MKKSSIIILLAAVSVLGASCKKYLDINTNPNSPTASNPDYVLPQAIVYTASNQDGFNDYGAETAGMAANAGGYGGFGDWWTYDWSTSDYTGLWSSTYDVLQDIQYVITSTKDSADLAYYTAIGDVLKAYNFELLVDTYNDVPYSQALLGQADVSPKYDSAASIYLSLANLLDTAVALINNAPSTATLVPATSDPLFGGNTTLWKEFANTIKLRLIIHASSVITFPNMTFDAAGFLTTDAVVNPGYGRTAGATGSQQNPNWNDWVGSYAGSAGDRAWMACIYATGFYNGQTLTDPWRGNAIYFAWDTISTNTGYYTYSNQLGYGGPISVSFAPAYSNAWYCTAYGQPYTGVNSITALGSNIGIMKGPDMGEVLMLASESYFLQAEANMRGILTTGTALANFNAGIVASYNYLYELPNGSLASGFSPADSATAYQAANATGANAYLANYNLAVGASQQLQAIITQKYIAMNMITSQEAWNEYRRTLYPVTSSLTSNPYTSFVSTLSQSSRPDRLPTRIMYPNTEYSSNASNVPAAISPYTSQIFWAHP